MEVSLFSICLHYAYMYAYIIYLIVLTFSRSECRRIADNDNPLITRVLLGPNEDVVKVYILNKHKAEISCEVIIFKKINEYS